MSCPVAFLTGTSGLIGGELAVRLRAAGWRVLTLRRSSTVTDGACITGDLLHTGCGVDAALLAEVELLVHCAADTRFAEPLHSLRQTNVEGTGRLLALAARLPRLRQFAHVSTAYIVGMRDGSLPEAPLEQGHPYCNAYEQSKHEAEALVWRWRDRIPVAIYRLSSVVGDSVTGRVRQYNYFHQLLRLVPRYPLPSFPADPAAPVDVIATDWAAAALAYLVQQPATCGAVWNVCAGPTGSLAFGQAMEQAFELVQADGQLGRVCLAAPRLVSADAFALSHDGTPGVLNRFLGVVGLFLPHLARCQQFETAQTDALLSRSGLVRPQSAELLNRVIRYCLATRWGQLDGPAHTSGTTTAAARPPSTASAALSSGQT